MERVALVTQKQRKHLESLFVLLAFLAAVWYFQDNGVVARLLFVPAVVYCVLNHRRFRDFGRGAPSPKQLIEHSRSLRRITMVILAVEILVAYSALLSGFRIDAALQGVGMLSLAVLAPLLPAIVISQWLLYRRLGNDKSG